MNTLFTRLFAVMFVVLALGAAAQAETGPLTDDDASKIQHIIAAQLTAFADDDAEGAFQTATPSVREAIGNSGRFLAMVRGAYPMVYRPASVIFHKPEKDEDTVLQLVEITDTDAKSWLAMFALEQQPDASWRISGCAVMANRWHAI
ncbi:MAG TPA: DUF4864 domain-containing protein [Ramlibacter sp.]|nr:DUF4864 domain-containing protein [Ramlibacter sp.]